MLAAAAVPVTYGSADDKHGGALRSIVASWRPAPHA
jgi:hypothetical protein